MIFFLFVEDVKHNTSRLSVVVYVIVFPILLCLHLHVRSISCKAIGDLRMLCQKWCCTVLWVLHCWHWLVWECVQSGLQTFSSIYKYDGIVFYGHETFIKCAEEFKRYDECSALQVCVTAGSTHYNFVKKAFPNDFSVVVSNNEEITAMLFNGTCNVATYDKSTILPIASSEEFTDKQVHSLKVRILFAKILTPRP